MPGAAISVSSLVRRFGTTTALDHVSLEIPAGTLFGLLGPNGAGKTTLLSILSTLLSPSEGSARVWGYDVQADQANVRTAIGIVFQDQSLDFELTARENLDIHGRLYGIDAPTRKSRSIELLKLVELDGRADDLVKQYSGGMKRRLEIARGLLHHPKVLFLDEPTLGLDPQTRRHIWEYVKKLNQAEQVTIILTTHYLEEADFLCDQIAIIDKGKIVKTGTPRELKALVSDEIVYVHTQQHARFARLLEQKPWCKHSEAIEAGLAVHVTNGAQCIPLLATLAAKNKVLLDSVNLKRPSLEDVFIHLTGHTIRDETETSGSAWKQHMRMARR